MTPRDDLNNLLNYALEQAGERIAETGRFDSFGAGMKADGQITLLTANEESAADGAKPDAAEINEAVRDALQSDARAGVYEAVFSCSDGAVTGDDGKEVDAIVIRLEHKSHEPVLVALPYWQEQGDWEFGELGRAPSGAPVYFETAAS
jgi:hypothetical protein